VLVVHFLIASNTSLLDMLRSVISIYFIVFLRTKVLIWVLLSTRLQFLRFKSISEAVMLKSTEFVVLTLSVSGLRVEAVKFYPLTSSAIGRSVFQIWLGG
jgi:hypothetical protein